MKYQVVLADTDSLQFCKPDQSEFSKDEINKLLEWFNEQFPDKINWEYNDTYSKFLVIKTKNYVYQGQDGKIKYKGSALRSPTLEPALKEFIDKIIFCIMNDKPKEEMIQIYNSYIEEIFTLKDISRWSMRKTISDKTLNSTRKNETKIADAIAGTEIVEGDRAYFYTKSNDTLDLIQNFNGDYCKVTLLNKLYKTSLRFETILSVKEMFINFSLKTKRQLLEPIIPLELIQQIM